jgi:hypothetical protein
MTDTLNPLTVVYYGETITFDPTLSDYAERAFNLAFEIYHHRHENNLWWSELSIELERKHGRFITLSDALNQLVEDPNESLYLPEEEITAISQLLAASGYTILDLHRRLVAHLGVEKYPQYA